MSGLAEQGFGDVQLAEMQRIIDAEKSDLFDVLAYVAYALPTLTPLLRVKYHNSIADAVADLGKPEEFGRLFAGFQKYLYEQVA